MSGVRHVTVDAEDGELRLDRWFRRHFPHLGHGRLARMLRKGEVRVDGARADGATRVGPGQTIRVPPLPEPDQETRAAPERRERQPADGEVADILSRVLHRDRDVIALDKPAGLAAQGGSGSPRHLGEFLEALRFERKQLPRLVHRLDRDTSGVILFGRTASAAAALSAALRSRAARKLYWAAVAGRPDPARGTIRYGLVKAPGPRGEKMICVHPDRVKEVEGAKRAVSDYAVIESAAKRASWMALRPVTGRTHQLRAHMAEIGCPIVGDGKYGGSGQTNEGDGWGARLGGGVSGKLHLHARAIEIPHPSGDGTLRVSAPLPPHMRRTWDMFGWRAEDAPEDPWED